MELAILIGLQASGKTTFYHSRLAATHAHVSKDLLRNNRRPQRREILLIAEALHAGRSVAVDNTNPSAAGRAALIVLGRACGAEITGYYFEPSIAASLQRNRERQGHARVPDIAIFATRKKLVPPSLAEGFDRLYSVRALLGGDFDIAPWPDPAQA
jgi:predicted kinase